MKKHYERRQRKMIRHYFGPLYAMTVTITEAFSIDHAKRAAL